MSGRGRECATLATSTTGRERAPSTHERTKHWVYLDNVIVSAQVRGDLAPAEQRALERILELGDLGRLKNVTSAETRREQGRTRDPAVRAKLDAARDTTPMVSRDYIVVGFYSATIRSRTSTTVPLVADIVDPPIFSGLGLRGIHRVQATKSSTKGAEIAWPITDRSS
jgi:hypothetical protein